MSETELPEHQIFSILRRGEEDPIGPYSDDQLVGLLNEGQVRDTDMVFYDGLDDWKLIRDVFDLHQGIANFEDDGQDQTLVAQVFSVLSEHLDPGEEIYYIAVQDKPTIRLKGPNAIAITEQRVCIASRKLNGRLQFKDFLWSEIHVASARRKIGEKLGVFSVLLRSGERFEVDRISDLQLNKLQQLANDFSADENVAI